MKRRFESPEFFSNRERATNSPASVAQQNRMLKLLKNYHFLLHQSVSEK